MNTEVIFVVGRDQEQRPVSYAVHCTDRECFIFANTMGNATTGAITSRCVACAVRNQHAVNGQLFGVATTTNWYPMESLWAVDPNDVRHCCSVISVTLPYLDIIVGDRTHQKELFIRTFFRFGESHFVWDEESIPRGGGSGTTGTTNRLKELCSNIDQWKLNKSSGSGDELVEVFIKDSDFKGAEEMYLLRTTYRTSVANLAALLYPWYPYRLKWDTLLESGEIIKKFAENNFIISHRTRGKYTLSARESVDAVKIVKEGINMYFASTCAPCGDVLVPIHDKYVRTTQYLGGYRLIQIDENRVEFCMLFHADLKLPIPKFLSSIVSSLKPKLMIEKVDNLRKAVKAMPVQAEHLDHQ